VIQHEGEDPDRYHDRMVDQEMDSYE